MQPDLQIRGGTLYDGLGSPGKRGCLDIKDGRITAVGGPQRPAREVIDATGLVVCPGFIDAHCHADLAAAEPAQTLGFLHQGVTTCIVGNCGFSAFPVAGEPGRRYLRYGAGVLGTPPRPCEAADFEAYGRFLAGGRLAVNLVSHVGHGTLHASLTGGEGSTAAMRRALHRLLAQGAAGVSLGLIYAPGASAPQRQLYALAEVAAECGKPVVVHLRNEGAELLPSIHELLAIARKTGAHIHFSHHKVMGRQNHGQSAQSLARLSEARAQGLRVSLDAYPYSAGCSTAMVLFPPWLLDAGLDEALQRLKDKATLQRIAQDLATGIAGWENLVAACGWQNLLLAATRSRNRAIEGKSLAAIAEDRGCSPLEALAEIVLREQGDASITLRGMCRQDVNRIILHPETLIGSDGLFSPGGAHPRKNGSFARVIRSYVVQRGVISLEAAIHKMTGKTAAVFNIPARGVLQAGYMADVAVFSPQQLADTASYLHPQRLARGMRHVLVAGRPALKDGKPTGEAAGRLLPI